MMPDGLDPNMEFVGGPRVAPHSLGQPGGSPVQELLVPSGGYFQFPDGCYGIQVVIASIGTLIGIGNSQPSFHAENGQAFYSEQALNGSSIQAGPNSPCLVRWTTLPRVRFDGGAIPGLQTQDLVTAAQQAANAPAGLVTNPVGIPMLVRDPTTGRLQVLNQLPAAAGVLTVAQIPVTTVLSDTSSTAGGALDTGALAWSGQPIGAWIEIVAGAALTASRTIDIRGVRPDATQYSFFDPTRNTASPFSWAIGRVNYFAAMGLGAGGGFSAAASAASVDWALGAPIAATGTAGVRVNIGAGGAEIIRVRVVQRSNTSS